MTMIYSRVYRQHVTIEVLWVVLPDEPAFRDWEGLIRTTVDDAGGTPGVCVLTDVAELEQANGARPLAEVPGRALAFAGALLELWGLQGGECPHGHGFAEDCPGGSAEGDERSCAFNGIRPLLREAHRLTGERVAPAA